MSKHVSIIMINYNTYEFTKNAINSLFEYTKDLDFELILIDNNSPDGSGERLKEEYGDQIKYIQSGDNLGTSKAFNIGLKEATGKYVLWLNTDIVFIENFIKKLYEFMEENPNCGICGGNLIGPNGEELNSYGRKILSVKEIKKNHSVLLRVFRKIFKKKLSVEHNYTGKPLRVGCIIGADMMIRAQVFSEIGNFNEKIFMYGEECEFTYRLLTKTNYTVISIPSARLIHLEGASFLGASGKYSKNRIREQIRGTSIFIEASYGEKEKTRYLKYIARESLFYGIIFKMLFKKDVSKNFMEKRKVAKGLLNHR